MSSNIFICVQCFFIQYVVDNYNFAYLFFVTKVSRFFYEPMIQFSGILDYRDFFLSDKIALISTLLIVG